MKITLLSPFLSSNGLGRAYMLAKILERRYPVEIVGPVSPGGIWEPLKGEEFCYTAVEVRPKLGGLGLLRALLEQADGDVIYASKPLLTSFGIGLLSRWRHSRPLVLDIDDWELAAYLDLPLLSRLRLALQFSANRLDAYYPFIRALHPLVHQADARTVSSSALQAEYGGVCIPHGRDTNRFDPARFNRQVLREHWGLEGHVIMFLGTPRPRKGLEDLLAAVGQLDRADVCLVIAGANPASPFTQQLASQGAGLVKLFGEQPFAQIPAFLAMADLVAIPQRADQFTSAQVPAKLYDAMAMARPIVSTTVSDIPTVLSGGCGLVVEPGNTDQLAEALAWCLDHPAEAGEMGFRARRKCIKMYSWDALEPILGGVFAPFE